MSHATEIGALRAALIGTKCRLEAVAAEYELRGEWQRAKWLREDIEYADAALTSPGTLLQLTRKRMSEAV